MRELRFRAWNEHDKLMADPFGLRENLMWRSKHETAVTYKALMPEDIVMQFTGLKDKNGEDIYEGDIISLIGATYTYVVKFEDYKFVCDHHNKPFGRWGDIYKFKELNFEIEIIGNIYQS